MFIGYDDFRKYIVKNLKRGTDPVASDRHAFEGYAQGSISFERMITTFCLMNDINRMDEIEQKYMDQWLESLGYRRYHTMEEIFDEDI